MKATTMRRILALGLALILTVAVLSGCGAKKAITATDDAGRQVTLKKGVPQRIISGAPSNTEILFALGLGSKVVGADANSDYPAEAKSVAKVGSCFSAQDTNYEQIVALKPDLFLAIKGQEAVVTELERLGVPVYVIDSPTIEDILKDITAIGKLTGTDQKAAEIVGNMKQRLDSIAAKVKDLPASQRPLVFYEVWNEPLMTAGPSTFVDSLITLAGGRNVASDAKAGSWPEYSLETLIKKDPAVVITTFADLNGIKARPGWANMKAVKDGRVLLVDPNIVVRPTPRIVDGLEQFLAVIHPELVK